MHTGMRATKGHRQPKTHQERKERTINAKQAMLSYVSVAIVACGHSRERMLTCSSAHRGLKEFLPLSRLGFLSRQLTNLLARADRGRLCEAWVRPEDLSGVGPL